MGLPSVFWPALTGLTMTDGEIDVTRVDTRTELCVNHAIHLQHASGVVSAWAFLAKAECPEGIIVRVLGGGPHRVDPAGSYG